MIWDLICLESAEISEYALDLAYNGRIIDDDRTHGLVLGSEIYLAVSSVEGLDGSSCFNAVNECNNYLAVSGFMSLLNENKVTVHNACIDHGLAFDAEHEVVAAVYKTVGKRE